MTPSTPFAPFVPYVLPPREELVVGEEPPAAVTTAMILARAGALGDVEATRRLLVELAPRIGRVVRAVLGGAHAELEDVQQQALLAFVQALPLFRGECEPTHFASRIAARTALTAARRSRAVRARHDDGVDVDQLASSAEPHDDLVRQRRKAMLRDLLGQLGPEQAETLTLRVVLGWSLPEISAATGAPVNTVRSRMRLAKRALRLAIDHDPSLAEEFGSHPVSVDRNDGDDE